MVSSKRYIKENNKLFTLTAINKELTFKGFDQVGAEDWKKLIEHVRRKFEDKYWAEDGLQEEGVDEFVFRVGGPEDESSGCQSSSDSEDSDFDRVFSLYIFLYNYVPLLFV